MGSSAALAIALVGGLVALSRPSRLELRKEEVFTLASLAYETFEPHGSRADLAAAAFGGLLAYEKPDIGSAHGRGGLHDIVTKSWPKLSIYSLPVPGLRLIVGWVGEPASTRTLVRDVLKWAKREPDAFQQFLTRSLEATHLFIEGCLTCETSRVLNATRASRSGLGLINTGSGTDIETPRARDAIDIAESLGGAGKVSGAGGGDLVMAWVENDRQESLVTREWAKLGVVRPVVHWPGQGLVISEQRV